MTSTFYRIGQYSLILVFLSLALTLTPALAVERLYSATVEVADQSPQSRSEAFAEAFYRVIVKLSGDRAAADNPVVVDAARRAQQMVQRFDYAQQQDAEGNRQRVLNVNFDRQAINRLLLDADIAFWGRERPDVLVWLASEMAGQRRMIGQDDREMASAMLETATQRGLQVFLPLLDLEEQQRVPQAELWGGYTDGVAEVAQRYGVKTFLVGRITENEFNNFSVRWELYDHGHTEIWRDGPNESMDELLVEGAHQLGDRLGARYSVRGTPADATPQRVVIHGVASSADYARVVRHLRQLSMVESVALIAANQDVLEINVSMAVGDGSRLVDAVRLGQVLQALPGHDSTGSLEFRVMP